MRKRCLDVVHRLAQKDPNVVFIGSDLGLGVLDAFKKELPEQFFMEGVSEQHIVGMAAGMALSGKTVFINTIATFLTRRCFEQNVVDLGMNSARVRLIGSGGGVVYAPLGPTHLATEDIAIMRAIPNMAVVAPCDAEEMERAVLASRTYDGPIYFRVAKGGDLVVSRPELGFEIGRAILHREPGEILFVTTGITLQIALGAAKLLETAGLRAGLLHMHTVKPFDKESLLAAAAKAEAVLSIEEHTIVGGLGSAVAEALAEHPFEKTPLFKRLGLPDAFPDQYGSQNSLMARYGLAPAAVADAARKLLAGRLTPALGA